MIRSQSYLSQIPVLSRTSRARSRFAPAFVGLILLPATWVQAQQPPAKAATQAAGPGGGPAGSTPPAQAVVAERRIGELRLEQTSLREVIQTLRKMDPGFQAVLAFDQGVPTDEPVIGELRLTNVTAGQVLEAISEAYPEVRITQRGDRPDSPIWSVRVTNIYPQKMVPPPEPQQARVFRLHETISAMLQDRGTTDRKEARAAVLSMLETALRAEQGGKKGEASEPVLQFHEPTETLIFRGARSQVVMVDQALEALQPKPPKGSREELEHLRAEVERLTKELERNTGHTQTSHSTAAGRVATSGPVVP